MPDLAQPPPAAMLKGFLGASDQEGYWRLYFTPEMVSYAEFPEEDVLRSQKLDADRSPPLGGTLVWFKRNARLQITRTVTQEVQAGFLQGDIAATFLPRAASLGSPPTQPEVRVTPTVIASIIYCPSLVAASIAWCTTIGLDC